MLVRFEQISKHYAGVRALEDVTFAVRAGAVHALVGENGAGKSTLMKILAGATPPSAGHILLDGRPLPLDRPRAVQAAGVAIVYQEFNLIPHLSVAENVFLGRWPRRCGLVDFRELRRRTRVLLDRLGLNLPPAESVAALSVAQQQLTEIAKALALDARVLILDEPSAVLTPHELATLFRLVRGLTQRGVSVLYISHRLEEIFELADDVTVLRDGRHVHTGPIDAIDRAGLIAACVGRALRDEFPPRQAALGPVQLRVERLSVRGRCEDVSFSVRAGEVLGLTGLVGSGRSSVALGIFGALPQTRGCVHVSTGAPLDRPETTPADGPVLHDRVDNPADFSTPSARGVFVSPRAAQRAGIALVPEDRRRQGLLMHRAVRENLTLAKPAEAAVAGVYPPQAEHQLAQRRSTQFSIRAAGVELPVGALSGGNQQKTLLARWLALPYQVFLLDEPTRGVDVGAKAEICALINALAARGAAVVMISSELPEIIGMADRIGVMCRGRLAGVLDNARRDASQEAILQLAIGAAAPLSAGAASL